jgi:class 3 adenylate cyclase
MAMSAMYASPKADSLVNELSKHNETIEKADLLINICKYYIKSDKQAAISYGNYALSLSEKLNYLKGKGKANFYLSYLFYKLDSIHKVVEYGRSALMDFSESHDTLFLGKAHNHLGNYFYKKNFYDKAIDEYLKAVKNYELLNDENRTVRTTYNIGLIYYQTKNYKKAETYWLKALESAEKSQNSIMINRLKVDIGLVYLERKEFDKALEYEKAVLKTHDEDKSKLNIGRVYNNIANIYKNKKDYKSSLKWLSKSEDIVKKEDDEEGKQQNLLDFGEIFLLKKKYGKSISYLTRCRNKSIENDNKLHLKDSYKLLYKAYEAIGNTAQAYKNFKAFIAIKDSVFSAESTQKLTQVQLEFEFDKIQQKKDLEQQKKDALSAAELRRQKLMRNAGIVGVILLLVLAYVLFNRYRLKKKSNEQLQEKNEIITDEKKKSEDLLHNILPVETANELKANGKVKARKYEMVSVGFTDFKGFTMLSEKLSPEELIDEIDRCFSVFDNIMDKYGLEKIKTIGDAYMFAGGIPGHLDEHPVIITQACLDIRDAIESIKQEKLAKDELFFEIRIGVHTGPLVAGVVGSKKFAYDIWGDTVNTAARMESSGDIGKVNVSGTTYELIKEHYDCTHRGKIAAKNKGDIDMYFVESSSA